MHTAVLINIANLQYQCSIGKNQVLLQFCWLGVQTVYITNKNNLDIGIFTLKSEYFRLPVTILSTTKCQVGGLVY